MALRSEMRRSIYQSARVLLLALLVAAVWPVGAGHADGQRIFIVTDIVVDETAETAVAARAMAEMAGRRAALTRLLKRLTRSTDWSSLPELEPNDILGLLKGHSVRDEKTSAVRYLGRLDFAFRPAAIRQLLDNYDLAFAETESTPVLIVPIFRGRQGDILWAEDNPWYDVFLKAEESDGLVPLILPYRELADMQSLSLQTALKADSADLAPLTERYATERAAYVIATVRPATDEQGQTLELKVIERNETGEGSIATEDLGAVQDNMLVERLTTAAVRARIAIEDFWKQRNEVRLDIESRVTVVVPVTDYQAWLQLGKSLDNVAGLRRWSVVQLGQKEAVIDLWTNGGIEQLRLALNHEQLQLAPGPVDWYLLPRDKAALPNRQQPATADTNQPQQTDTVPATGNKS